MVNNNEQTEEYEDIFYVFTFKEENRKDLKTNDLKRKGNFGFGKFSYRKSILELLIFYVRELKYGREIYYRYLRMSPERFSYLLSLVRDRISKKDNRF